MSFAENEKERYNRYDKLANFYFAVESRLSNRYLEKLLENGVDINCKIPNNCSRHCSLLHFAYSKNNIDSFKLLLEHGADFSSKNDNNSTIVHQIISENYVKYTKLSEVRNLFIDAILSAHVRFENIVNPCNNNGISHFHAACMTNNTTAVEFFLKNGQDVNKSVSPDSPIFSGYTPLHFAARYCCVKTAKMLLQHGADLNLTDAAGMNPLHLLVERKLKMINECNERSIDSNDKMMQLFLNTRLSNIAIFTDRMDLSCFHAMCMMKEPTMFHYFLERVTDIKGSDDANSPICPGFTALHFAAIANVNSAKLLIAKGANIEANDANGLTPFDLCLQRYDAEDICFVMSSNSEWKNILMSDGKTKLLDVVSAMQDSRKLVCFLKNIASGANLSVPVDSPIFAGYTLLHLSVIFTEKTATHHKLTPVEKAKDLEKIQVCLDRGVDVTTQDFRGSTPLHLAFYLQKYHVVALLLQHQDGKSNPVNESHLSLLHIACAAKDKNAVERFLTNGVNVNGRVQSSFNWPTVRHRSVNGKPKSFLIHPGSTALHVNVASGNVEITKLLLTFGADVCAKDVYGFTPVHRLLFTHHCRERINDLLLSVRNLTDCTATCGLTHLHVASFLGNVNAVKNLLRNGADIEATVAYKKSTSMSVQSAAFLSRYTGFTPLNIALQTNKIETARLLISAGANLFAKSPAGIAPIYKILSSSFAYKDIIVPILKDDNAARNRMEEEVGLTMLHVACYAIETEMVEDLIRCGADVNAQTHIDSAIWPGCTALHLAIVKVTQLDDEEDDELKKIVDLLLDNEADVTLVNKEQNTPIHLTDGRLDRTFTDSFYAGYLLRHIKNFHINPTNRQGISFFHVACIKNNVAVVEQFLKHGVDANSTVERFSQKYPGCTPLHLSVNRQSNAPDYSTSRLRTVDLLLEYGANVCIGDAYNNTPLHIAAAYNSSRKAIFERILRAGADLNVENIFGETVLEVLLKSGSATNKEIDFLLKYNCRINAYNPINEIGYIPRIFTKSTSRTFKALTDPVFRQLIKDPNMIDIDKKGRTVIHNVVSISYTRISDYAEIIGYLIKRDCDIDHQDEQGRTALHIAAQFKNNRGIYGLLRNGADVNVIDAKGKTPFEYAFEQFDFCEDHLQQSYHDPDHVIGTFALHVHKMQHCKLFVSQVNMRMYEKALMRIDLRKNVLTRFHDDVEKTKGVRIGSLSLYDFAINVDAVRTFSKMLRTKSISTDAFFEAIDKSNLRELGYLIKLQHKQVLERISLMKSATALFSYSTELQLPELCSLIVIKYLTNEDLRNLIAVIMS